MPPPTAREQLATSALLKELPWICDTVLSRNSLEESYENDPYTRVSSLSWSRRMAVADEMQKFAGAVTWFENNVLLGSTAPYRKVFRVGQPASFAIAEQDEDEEICDNDRHTAQLAVTLFAYRLLDLSEWLAASERSLQGVRRGKLPERWLIRLVSR